MVKEAYVSFETAKLLKEKGFPEGYQHSNYFMDESGNQATYTIGEDIGKNIITIPRPTHQMAMAWLRKEHNIEIAISYGIVFDSNTAKQVFRYFWSIVKVNGLCLEYPMNNPDDMYYKEIEANSYEKAIEDAIKYCLENLI